MSWNTKSLIVGAVLICFGAALWIARERRQPTVSYSQFLELVESGKVASAVIVSAGPGQVNGRLKDGGSVRTLIPADSRDAIAAMQAQRVDLEIRNASSGPSQLLKAVPFLVLLGMWVFLMWRLRNRPRRGSGG